jgi:hypothetical protein
MMADQVWRPFTFSIDVVVGVSSRRYLDPQIAYKFLALVNQFAAPAWCWFPIKSISKSNGNRLGAAHLVCMTEVSDLPNQVAGRRRLPGMRMSRRNAFGMGLRKKPERSGPENFTLRTRPKLPNCQTTRKTGGYAHA